MFYANRGQMTFSSPSGFPRAANQAFDWPRSVTILAAMDIRPLLPPPWPLLAPSIAASCISAHPLVAAWLQCRSTSPASPAAEVCFPYCRQDWDRRRG
jgi:hypothetical protein